MDRYWTDFERDFDVLLNILDEWQVATEGDSEEMLQCNKKVADLIGHSSMFVVLLEDGNNNMGTPSTLTTQ